jgi:E3 ubiquitin-protein ligase HUWE1
MKITLMMDSGHANRLPCARTCFNELQLPIYDSLEMLQSRLSLALREGVEGFGLA